MNDISPIDVAVLETQTFGDRGLERDVLRLFADQATRIAHHLEPATEGATAPEQLGSDVHLLKGSALAIGAVAVAAAALALEEALQTAAPRASSAACMATLRRAIAQACRQAEELIDRNQP